MKLGNIIVNLENQDSFKELTECGNIYVSENARFSAPALTTSGYIYVMQDARFSAPTLTTSGNILFSFCFPFTDFQLEQVSKAFHITVCVYEKWHLENV